MIHLLKIKSNLKPELKKNFIHYPLFLFASRQFISVVMLCKLQAIKQEHRKQNPVCAEFPALKPKIPT